MLFRPVIYLHPKCHQDPFDCSASSVIELQTSKALVRSLLRDTSNKTNVKHAQFPNLSKSQATYNKKNPSLQNCNDYENVEIFFQNFPTRGYRQLVGRLNYGAGTFLSGFFTRA